MNLELPKYAIDHHQNNINCSPEMRKTNLDAVTYRASVEQVIILVKSWTVSKFKLHKCGRGPQACCGKRRLLLKAAPDILLLDIYVDL